MATPEQRERAARFGRWMVEMRERAGVTQAELARRAGVDRVLINRIEGLAAGRASARTPYRPGPFLPVLQELSRLHRRDLVTEGFHVWGYPVPLEWNWKDAPADLRELAPARLEAHGAEVESLVERFVQLPARRRQILSLLLDELAS